MKIQEEKSFPRGGKKLIENKTKILDDDSFKRKREASQSFPQGKTTKKVKLKPHAELREITVKTLSEGMVLLGCVREVHATELKINLPGRIIGYVPATNISEEYSVYLKNAFDDTEMELIELNHIFKPGQFVITKVEEVVVSDEVFRVTLTLNPSAIYSDFSFKDVVNGIVISASVQSVEDHGYVMNCGVHGVRAFLKKSRATNFEETWNGSKNLAVGQVLRCLVVKCSVSDGCSNVGFQADPETVTEAKLDDVPLKSVIPGMLFEITVTKITTAGIVVKFAEDNVGFVHANHLNVDLNYIEKGTVLSGRILYVESLTKNVFLTTLDNVGGLRPLPLPFENFGKGTVFKNAKVTNINGGHLILKLDEDNDIYGYVTSQQVDIESTEDPDVALSEQLKKIYPIGSLQKSKVLEYDYMMQKYNCTLRKKIIKQKFTCLEEVSPGIVTTCTVVKSTPREILLQVGAVRGTVEPMHCTDVPVKCPDTLLQVGQKVKAKVLSVKIPICEFTLKPALVHSEHPILTRFSDAQYDVPYDGVIVNKSPHGVLVKFYGGYVQFVPYKRMEGRREELERSYYFGQVVTCYVKEMDSDKQTISFSVEPHPLGGILKDEDTKEKIFRNFDRGPFKVGKLYKVCVEDVTPEGLTIRVKANDIVGWIPPTQLTDCPEFAQFLCQTYKKGEELHAFCLRSKDRPLFTISPTFMKYFESDDGKKITKCGVSALRNNMIAPSTVIKIHDESITVAIPLREGEHHVSIKKIHICNGTVEKVASLNIQMRQTLLVQIRELLIGGSNGTTKLSSVWNKTLMSEIGIMLLQNYLTCHKKIHNFLRNEGHPLGQLVIGSKVKGTVLGVNLLGAVINLENGAKAVLMPEHYKDVNIEENMSIEGTVLFVDLINQCAEITMSQAISKNLLSLSKQQFIGRTSRCVTYVSRSDVVIAGMKFGKHNQIAYIPSRWHVNDLRPSPYYTVGEAGNVVVKIHEDELLIAVPRKVSILERKHKNDVNTSDNGRANNSEKTNDLDICINTSVVSENGVKKKKAKSRKDSADSKHACDNDILEHADNTKNNIKLKSINNVGEFSIVDISKKIQNKSLCEKDSTKSRNSFKKNKKDTSPSSENRVKKRKRNADSNEDSVMDTDNKQSCDNDNLDVDSTKSNIKRKSVGSVGEFSIVVNSKKRENKNIYQKDSTECENAPKKSKKESKIDTSPSVKKKNTNSNEDSVVDNRSEHACDNDIPKQTNSAKTKVKNKSVNNLHNVSLAVISKKRKNISAESDNMPKENEKESRNENDPVHFKTIFTGGKENKKGTEKKLTKAPQDCLDVRAGFVWNATLDQLPIVAKQKKEDAASSSDEEPEENSKKKKQQLTVAEKRTLAREEEERLRKTEERLLRADKNPQSADDFDRLVMSAPNNSQNWIKYMAFHLQATEIEKARAVAERALKTICFREEQEKLNVWTALLNLENLFGTQESLGQTLEEAVKVNDEFKVRMQVLNMYSTTKKFEELGKMVQFVTKKYKDDKRTWIEAGMAYVKCGEVEKSRQLMQQALNVLQKKDHVEILTRFALMENDWGESERAETIMEKILTSYPKRVDVWNVYIDMLVKSKKLEIARRILDRAVIQKLPANKMKSLFKKYLKFENDYGTHEGVERVREMAKSYVENVNT